MFYRLGKDSEKPQMEGGNRGGGGGGVVTTPPPPPPLLPLVRPRVNLNLHIVDWWVFPTVLLQALLCSHF